MESWNNITWFSVDQKYIREMHFRLHNKSWLLLSRINQIKTLTDFRMRGIKISIYRKIRKNIFNNSRKSSERSLCWDTNEQTANIYRQEYKTIFWSIHRDSWSNTWYSKCHVLSILFTTLSLWFLHYEWKKSLTILLIKSEIFLRRCLEAYQINQKCSCVR